MMQAKPAKLCKLEKGKLIDAQDGFVDTFNWMVDVINALSSSGLEILSKAEYDAKKHKFIVKKITVKDLASGKNATTDHTVFTATPISEE